MSKSFAGKARVEIEGKEYTLVLDFNAMCEFEAATGKNAFETIQAFETGAVSASDLRALMWSTLVADQPEITLREAGALLSAAPDAIQKALAAAAPDAEPGKK